MRRRVLTKSLSLFLVLFLVSLLAYSREGGGHRAAAASLILNPSFCLGGWDGSEKAAGLPESQSSGIFSSGNSAVLNQKSAQIFC